MDVPPSGGRTLGRRRSTAFFPSHPYVIPLPGCSPCHPCLRGYPVFFFAPFLPLFFAGGSQARISSGVLPRFLASSVTKPSK